MPHDKIKAAARRRIAETGEPYTAARRAAVSERQGPGYALAMSGEIHDWLTELRASDPPTALRVMQALVTLMEKGASLGDPLVAAARDSWPAVVSRYSRRRRPATTCQALSSRPAVSSRCRAG